MSVRGNGRKLFCFRFDVDTHVCAQRGVPNLVALAGALGVPFTFFFNMGRGVSRLDYLRKQSRSNAQRAPSTAKLSNLEKLGYWQFARVALFNPWVGRAHPKTIRAAHEQGHEVGLHGGRNHGEWMQHASAWSEGRFREEVSAGQRLLTQAGVPPATSFSSPGWQGPAPLHAALESLDFDLIADLHGEGFEESRQTGPGERLWSVPTNLTGEPVGVGYIENLRARGFERDAIVEEFRSALQRVDRIAVVYDHPYFAGIRELSTVERMVKSAQELGFEVVTLKEIARHHEAGRL
jgi:peptidoglycan/xylan/chitin deacetylase (PgdA/CDA1 family)